MRFLIVLVLALATVNAARLGTQFLKPAFTSGRIINGVDAAKGEAPYIVSLQYTARFGAIFCAGSLIRANFVLTAGHCLDQPTFDVVAGLHVRTDNSGVQVRHVSSAQQYKQHEEFSGDIGPYDIGLIYIPEAFELNTLGDTLAPVATISLPSNKYPETGMGKLYGWGISMKDTEVLQILNTDIISYQQCEAALEPNDPITEESNICTHAPGKTDGACNGDSGGPLIINTPDGAELVGIVSWGYSPCYLTTYPSIHTKVSGFLSWIEEAAADLERVNA